MNTEILGVALQVILMVVLAYPLGKYIAKVYKGQKTWSDFMKPVERLIFKVSGINPQEETVLESIVDIECFLVCVGHGTAGYSTLAASKP